jgi:hypothetical protein
VVPCEFDSAFKLINGLGRIIKDGKTGYLGVSGKIMIPAVYEEGENFAEGFAFVKKDGQYFYINTLGVNTFKKNFPFPALPKTEGQSDAVKKMFTQQLALMRQESSFQEGRAKFYDTVNKKVGFIDTKGATVIPDKYIFATRFSEGIAIVKESMQEPAKAIDKTGKQLFSLDADVLPVGEFKNGFIKVMKRTTTASKYNYIDIKGKLLTGTYLYDDIKLGENGYFIFTMGSKMGAISKDGTRYFGPSVNYLGSSVLKGIFYFANRDSKGNIAGYGLMDSTGNMLTGQYYFEFEKANDTVLLARKKEGSFDNNFCHYTLLSVNSGKELCKPDYLIKEWNTVKGQPILYLFENRYNRSNYRQNWCFFNPKKGVLAEYYDDRVTTQYKLGLFIAPKEGRVFDLMGQTILDSAACINLDEYRKDVPKVQSDVILVKGDKSQKWYAYNLATKKTILKDLEVPGEAYGVHPNFTEGLFPITRNGLWGYADANGKIVIPLKYTQANSFYHGWALVVQVGSVHFFIDKAGKKMPGLETGWAEDFYEGVARIQTSEDSPKGEQIHYINTAGKVVFTPELPDFFAHGNMKEGLAAVCNKDKKYGYIDKSGKLVIPYQFDLVDSKFPSPLAFANGKATVKKDGKVITIDKTGRPIQ